MGLERMAAALAGVVVLSACTGAVDDRDDPAGGAGAATPAGATEATFVSLDTLTDEVQAAIADASARFRVPEAEVAVAGALDVVWADGSLGCPEPDMAYTQALVDGYLLTLEVGGDRVSYHGEDGRPPFLCER